ncbi:MAG: hypothetical protein RL065_874 [Bacteroidota bacterium]|jgi:ribonuclease P protein component
MTVSLTEFTFKKQEKLCSTKQLNLLFEKGKGFYQTPLRLIYLETNQPQIFPVQIVITVSKRNFKKAVDRNRIKRLIRENYRLNKAILYQHLQQKNKKIFIGIIYTGKEMPEFDNIKSALLKGIEKLIQSV